MREGAGLVAGLFSSVKQFFLLSVDTRRGQSREASTESQTNRFSEEIQYITA